MNQKIISITIIELLELYSLNQSKIIVEPILILLQ